MLIFRCDWCRTTVEMSRQPREEWQPAGWMTSVLRENVFSTTASSGPRFDFCSLAHQEAFVAHMLQTAGADPHDHRSSR